MPQINPLYLRPVVTYMMYFLSHNDRTLHRILEPDEVLIKAMLDVRFAGIPEDEFRQALDRAQSNVAATQRAMSALGTITLQPDGSYGT